ncbi:DUF6894 family protein [Methylobacterium nigriterrae]|uniref:DUF6894 family protein n=1 Tax=Methylobacterium nigriterrae TaxID=3127512 RepID=UPI003013DBD1
MAERFHFRLVNTVHTLEDPIGACAGNLDEAEREALLGIEELRLMGELPADIEQWHLEIRSASGVLLRSIALC